MSPTAQGTIVSANRYEQKIRDEYSVDGKVIAMPGQHGLMAYIGTDRGTLYAFNMDTSRMQWRFLPGGDIMTAAIVSTVSYAVVFVAALIAYKRVTWLEWQAFFVLPSALRRPRSVA